MARKEITTTTTRTVHICDRCGKQVDNPQTCNICGRECGYCCASGMAGFTNLQDQRVLDPFFRVCKACQKAGEDVAGTPMIDLIRQEVRRADQVIGGLLDRWREMAKERDGKA